MLSNEDRTFNENNYCGLLSYCSNIVAILEDLCNKYFTSDQTHEPLSLKFHLLACCFKNIGEHYNKELNNPDIPKDKPGLLLKGLIRRFLYGVDPYGLPAGMLDLFLFEIRPGAVSKEVCHFIPSP